MLRCIEDYDSNMSQTQNTGPARFSWLTSDVTVFTDNEKQLLVLAMFSGYTWLFKILLKHAWEHITIVLVRAMRVAVESAGLSVCGPASVSNSKVCEQLLVQVQWVFFWTSKHNDQTL